MAKRTYPTTRSSGLSDEDYIQATLDRLDFNRAIQSLRSSTRVQKLRERVLLEEAVCHICGDKVDKTLPGHHRDGPTMEHLIPVRTARGVWHFFDRA